MPVQNQQFAIAQAPVMALSQPSYAPTRVLPGLQARPNQPGPRMFQQALIRVCFIAVIQNLPYEYYSLDDSWPSWCSASSSYTRWSSTIGTTSTLLHSNSWSCISFYWPVNNSSLEFSLWHASASAFFAYLCQNKECARV